MSIAQVNHRGHVASACVNCKKVHLACDNSRPCRRCYNVGKSDTCKDVASKKRGRRRINNPEDPAKKGVITIQSSPNIHFFASKARTEPNEAKTRKSKNSGSCKSLVFQHTNKESMRAGRAKKISPSLEVETMPKLESQSPEIRESPKIEYNDIQVNNNEYYGLNLDRQDIPTDLTNEMIRTKDSPSFFVLSPLTGLIIKCTDRASSLLGCSRRQLEGVAFFQNFLTSPQSSEFLKGTVKVAQTHISDQMIFEAGDEALLRTLTFCTAQDIWTTVSDNFQTPIRRHDCTLPMTLSAGRIAMLHSIPFGASCWKMFDARMAFHNVLIGQGEFVYPQNVPLLLVHTDESTVKQPGWEERNIRESNHLIVCNESVSPESTIPRHGQMELQQHTRPSMTKRSRTDPEIYRLSKMSNLSNSTDKHQLWSVEALAPKTQETFNSFQAIPRTFSKTKSDCIKLPPLCELKLTAPHVKPPTM